MTDEDEIIGVTKISRKYRMGLLAPVREEMEEDVEEGDRIVFRKNEDADVVLDVA